jgi:hypothetical protein
MSRIVEPMVSRGAGGRGRSLRRQDRLEAVRIVLAVALLAAGCAGLPTGRFDALATAAKEVETRATTTDADVVALTRRFMIFSPASGPYTVNSFAPVIDVDGTKVDFDFGPRLEPRQAALDVLASYTEALAAFARKDYQRDLDRATQKLGGSVERLVSHAGVSADAKQAAGILATAVNGLGRALIDHMRKAALRQSMDTAAPGVRSIAAFVKEINGQAALAVGVMRDAMISKSNRFTVSDGVARLDLNERVEGVVVESKAILAQLKQVSTAVAAIPPAHDEIRLALDRDDRPPLDRLKSLVAEVQRLQKYYSSLK